MESKYRIASLLLSGSFLLTSCGIPTAFEGQRIPRTEWTVGPDGKKSAAPFAPNADQAPSDVEAARLSMEKHLNAILLHNHPDAATLKKEAQALYNFVTEAFSTGELVGTWTSDFKEKAQSLVDNSPTMTALYEDDAPLHATLELMLFDSITMTSAGGKVRGVVPLSAVTIRDDKATIRTHRINWHRSDDDGKTWYEIEHPQFGFPDYHFTKQGGEWKIDVSAQYKAMASEMKSSHSALLDSKAKKPAGT